MLSKHCSAANKTFPTKVLFEWKIVPQFKILYGKVSILTVQLPFYTMGNHCDFFPQNVQHVT